MNGTPLWCSDCQRLRDRVVELEAERETTLAGMKAMAGISEGRRTELLRLASLMNDEWRRAENAEAENARLRTALESWIKVCPCQALSGRVPECDACKMIRPLLAGSAQTCESCNGSGEDRLPGTPADCPACSGYGSASVTNRTKP